MVSRATAHAAVPERTSTVRVLQYESLAAVRADPGAPLERCEYAMTYYDDLRGSIPKAVLNYATSQGLPGFIRSLCSACVEYGRHKGNDAPL